MEKYLGQYRVASARAPFWDYGWEGAYFVTPCAANHECIFGDIVRDESGKAFLQPSFLGEIVLQEWAKSFVMRPELQCDIFQLMPNHLHAILRISGNAADENATTEKLKRGVAYRSPKSISSFMSGFKAAVSLAVNTERNTPGLSIWQPRFNDQIIKNNRHYNNVFQYIETNPEKWIQDEFYKR